MYKINHLPPDRMTLDQRRLEVASILAAGIARLHSASFEKSENELTESEFEVAITHQQSVHDRVLNNKRKVAK